MSVCVCVCVCVFVCMCSLNYTTRKAHAPYFIAICGSVLLCHICRQSLKQNDFRVGDILLLLDIKCSFWFSLQLSSEMCLFLRSNEWDIVRNVRSSSNNVPAILVRFYWKFPFLRFSKNYQIPNLRKIRPVRSWIFPVDRHTSKS
jgi:hypothetical protein